MIVRPFTAIFPQATQSGDEVVIKGKVKDDAQIFSINFTLDINPNPSSIAYHFKTIFADNTVVQNFKSDGAWNEEEISENKWIQGPGQEFVLTFRFTDGHIIVYTDDENRCFQYRYEHKFEMADIKAIQVWDDAEYINEIIFRYQKY